MSDTKDLPANINQDYYQQLRVRINNWVEEKGDQYQYTEYLLFAPDLLHLLCRLIVDRRISKESRALLGIATAYFISPVDLIPEAFMGPTGYADDVVVAVVALNRIINEDNVSVVREHWAGDQDVLEVIQRILKLADEIIGSGAWKKIMEMFDQNEDNAE